MKSLVGIIVLAALVSASVDYTGYKVYRVVAETEAQRDFLRQLEDSSLKYDFWSSVNKVSLPVHIMVAPKDQAEFTDIVTSAGMEVEIYMDDVQGLVTEQEKNVVTRFRTHNEFDFQKYHSMADINDWLQSLPSAYPDRVTLQNLGRSHEGRDTLGVKISFGAGRKSVVIEGGIHSREWISPATVLYIINELLTSQDPAFRRVAENFDWHIFPVVNPDGYVFSQTSNRMWRKTRGGGSWLCPGTDGNRNFDIYWGVAGTSSLACAQNYGGSGAFSVPETVNLANYLREIGHNIDVYLSFHSFSQLLLLPYGHTGAHLDNYAQSMRVATRAINALERRYGTRYIAGNVFEVIYPASGGSADWVKSVFQPPISYVYELRDQGRHGFLLPEDQIEENNLEVIDSLIAIFEAGQDEQLWTL